VLAFLPQFTDPGAGPIWPQIAILGTLFSVASIPFNISYGAMAGYFSERLRRLGGLMNKISAIVFGGLAARLAIN
jgi:threonine/homoserine/homoserine lactone efflux protein